MQELGHLSGSCLDTDGLVLSTPWVDFNGWHFVYNTIVVLKNSHESEDAVPQFGKVVKVYVQNNVPYLAVKAMDTVQFDEHFHAYEVEELSDDTSIIPLKDALKCEPLWLLKSFVPDCLSYVCPRYTI